MNINECLLDARHWSVAMKRGEAKWLSCGREGKKKKTYKYITESEL